MSEKEQEFIKNLKTVIVGLLIVIIPSTIKSFIITPEQVKENCRKIEKIEEGKTNQETYEATLTAIYRELDDLNEKIDNIKNNE